MKVLALDLSTHSSGFAIGTETELLDYGCISSSKKNVIERIYIMKDTIEQLLQEHAIDKVVVEEVRTDYQNAHTYKVLTWLQAAIVFAVYNYNKEVEIEYLQPSSWRSKIGIKTGAGIRRDELKQADIQWVKNKYGIDVNDDIADAICIYNSLFIKEPTAVSAGFAW